MLHCILNLCKIMTYDILYKFVFYHDLVAECAEFNPDTAPHCHGRDALLRHEPHLRATTPCGDTSASVLRNFC